jgi:hypothetical protein
MVKERLFMGGRGSELRRIKWGDKTGCANGVDMKGWVGEV